MNLNKQQQNEAYISRYVNGTPRAMYDIGVGHKTEWQTLKDIYPKMRLFGCEPNPKQYRELSDTFTGSLRQVAISGAEGLITLNVAKALGQSSIFDISYAERKEVVQTITLDQFDEYAGKPDRILLWIDIEGAELIAFKSAPNLMKSGRVKWINLEERREGQNPGKGWADAEELKTFLTQCNYKRVVEYNRHVTHQDVIYVHDSEIV